MHSFSYHINNLFNIYCYFDNYYYFWTEREKLFLLMFKTNEWSLTTNGIEEGENENNLKLVSKFIKTPKESLLCK